MVMWSCNLSMEVGRRRFRAAWQHVVFVAKEIPKGTRDCVHAGGHLDRKKEEFLRSVQGVDVL